MENEPKKEPICPNCKVAFENDHIGDGHGGNVLITVYVTYCPKCLYVYDSKISLSN